MLPRLDGLEVCKRLRSQSNVPIIMLTARGEELDKVLGLELGADDYITKPFSIREFRSRVRALLRRAASPHLAGEREEVIERGELRIDVPRRTVEVRGEAVQLTFIEFEMLVVLAQSPGVVFSRRELLERLRGGADYREPRTIDVHVRHLREKIERDPERSRADPHDARRGLSLQAGVDRVSLPGGIRIRIVLVLVGIVAGALGTAYMIVVPSLERRLVDARLEQLSSLGAPLARDAAGGHAALAGPRRELRRSRRTHASSPSASCRRTDRRSSSSRIRARRARGTSQNDPVALAALAVGRARAAVGWSSRSGTTRRLRSRPGRRRSCSSRPRSRTRSRPSRSSASACCWRRRSRSCSPSILGLTAAGMLAHRLLRLETAAERIAGGDFDAPIVDHGNDEIGELARAFDRMRVQLAQLDNARKEFVANASHELRTPLFSIGGFLELLADEELDEETRRGFIETMQGQVQRLAKLSTDLLDLSRVDAGQLTVDARSRSISAAIVQMLAGELGHLGGLDRPRAADGDRRRRLVPR